MEFTEDQSNAFEEIKDIDSWDIFILTGQAGSGKTQLLYEIQEHFQKNKWKIYPGSFTGRAAAVLRRRGLENARTIAYYFYGRPTIYQEFKKLWKLVRLKFTRETEDKEVWLIDESSMLYERYISQLIEHIYNPDEQKLGFIGKKLQELYESNEYEITQKKKIIFCGDEDQLPPVYGAAKPALKEETFTKLGFKTKSFKLTSNLRHKNSSDIQKVARILDKHPNQIGVDEIQSLGLSDENVEILESNSIDFIAQRFLELFEQNPLQIKYISYKNQFVHEFNLFIRTLLFETGPRTLLCEGELVHVMKNNYFYDLWNGDYLVIEKIEKTFDGRDLDVLCYVENEKGNKVQKKDSEGNKVLQPLKLSFTRVKARHTETNREYTFFIVDETLNNTDGDNWIYRSRDNLYQELTEYLQKFFFYRNPELVGQPYADWKEERETDPYNNAIFANYSYGITGYKSQGGEWDYIMVDLNTGMRTVPKGYFYTSVTRATKKIIIIPPRKESF